MTGAAADDSKALKAIVDMLRPTIYEYTSRAENDSESIADALAPLVLAYGREQATRGAEQALRVAQMAADSEGDAARGQDRDAWIFFRDWLANRADDLGRQP